MWGSIYNLLTVRVVYHGLLWAIYVLLMLLLNLGSSWWFAAVNVGIHTGFVMSLVYLNLDYLFPLFFSRKRFVLYFFGLVFATAVATPLEVICLYWNVAGFPAAQAALVENQWVHFAFLGVVVLTSTALRMGKEWFVQQRVQRDLEWRNLQSELSFLKSQINPHFLFNTLNSLYALTLKKSDKAPEIVLRLSEMMRYMLYECNEKIVPLAHELQYIQNYIELERIRYGTKAHIAFGSTLDAENYEIAPLIFIPFFENAFKHGLSNHIREGFVEGHVEVRAGLLLFELENSKTDLKDERYFQGGIGLKNVRRRLELIYPQNHELTIEEEEDTYRVLLKIKL